MFILSALLGACLGSFALWLVDHYPDYRWDHRSHCLSCGHMLSAKDLIPVFSWLLQRGRCRYCGVQLSRAYIQVEMFFALSYIILAYFSDQASASTIPLFLLECALLFLLLIMSCFDYSYLFVPDRFMLCFFAFLLLYICWSDPAMQVPLSFIDQPLAHIILLTGLYFIYQLFPSFIGGADIKLMMMISLLSLDRFSMVILLASLCGIAYHIIRSLKRPSPYIQIPFIPCLSFGFFLVQWVF